MPVSSWWRTLSRVLRIGNARYIVGHDLEQNTYMELPSLHGDPKRTRRVVKWKSLSNLSDFNPKEMPIQWDAWMRHTRQHPPTIEELLKDRERQRIVQHNARVLAIRDEAERAQLEAQRATEHAEALQTQAAREKRRLEIFDSSSKSQLEQSEETAHDSGIESATIRPGRRRGV